LAAQDKAAVSSLSQCPQIVIAVAAIVLAPNTTRRNRATNAAEH
jgi:hypothetical protein